MKVKVKTNHNYKPPASVVSTTVPFVPLTHEKQAAKLHDTFYNLNCIINEQTNIIESQQETIEYLQYLLNDREQQIALLLDERATCCNNCSNSDLSKYKVSRKVKVKVKPRHHLERHLSFISDLCSDDIF